jgi:FkbM family methyltransferase
MKIKEQIKYWARKSLNTLHIDLTKNLEYDRLTEKILNRELKNNSNCIDVGCHKGEILEIILKNASQGKHFAFEPIPVFYQTLLIKFQSKTNIYPYALAEQSGNTTFQFVKNAPAYSGLKQRKYDIENPEIEEIDVEIKRMDEVIPLDVKIDLIKIDVEGAEMGVLLGASKILDRHKPMLIFEFGMGASNFYGTTPRLIFDYLVKDKGYQIFTLKSFVNKGQALEFEVFEKLYSESKEYYFVAK